MIILYIIVAAFALVAAVDEVSARIAARRARLHGALGGQPVAAADDPPVSGNLHAVIDSVGDEAGRVDFAFSVGDRSNVRPIHHRRSLAHPYLKVVAVDEATRDLLDQNETPAA